jgi:hypothetical protein
METKHLPLISAALAAALFSNQAADAHGRGGMSGFAGTMGRGQSHPFDQNVMNSRPQATTNNSPAAGDRAAHDAGYADGYYNRRPLVDYVGVQQRAYDAGFTAGLPARTAPDSSARLVPATNANQANAQKSTGGRSSDCPAFEPWAKP